MADAVVPVLKQQLRDNLHDNAFLHDPLVLQLTKFRPSAEKVSLRVGDGESSIAGLLASDTPYSFGEQLRIVRVLEYKFHSHLDANRVFVEIKSWEDVGPSTTVVGSPQPLKYSDVVADQNSGNGHSNTEAGNGAGRDFERPVSADGTPIVSIESLSPFITKWKVLARATKRSEIREYTSRANNNTGRLFNVIFTDETGDIKATGFNDSVDQFYDSVVEGQQYYISKFQVRSAEKKFNTTGHDFELFFTRDSVVEPAYDSHKTLPSVFFKFVPNITALSELKVDSNVDVIGVAMEVGDVQVITSKSSNIPYKKRDIVLGDDSGRSISLTLWGADADEFNSPVGTVVGVKGARLSDFNGLSLSATRSAKVVADPDEKQAHRLKGWYNANVGNNLQFEKVAAEGISSQKREADPLMTVQAVHDKRLGLSDRPEYFKIRARVAQIYQRNVAYPSCSLTAECKKKVVEESGGTWRCEKCNASMSEPHWRYLLSLLISDVTNDELGMQVSVFDDIGRILYGDHAKEFQEIHEAEPDGFNRQLASKLNTIKGSEFIWSLKATLDVYNGSERPRYTALSASPPDAVKEGSELLSDMGF